MTEAQYIKHVLRYIYEKVGVDPTQFKLSKKYKLMANLNSSRDNYHNNRKVIHYFKIDERIFNFKNKIVTNIFCRLSIDDVAEDALDPNFGVFAPSFYDRKKRISFLENYHEYKGIYFILPRFIMKECGRIEHFNYDFEKTEDIECKTKIIREGMYNILFNKGVLDDRIEC